MPSFADQFTSKLHGDFIAKQNAITKEALIVAGFDAEDKAFITAEFTVVQREVDPFNHLYYHFGKPDQRRIISIQRAPDINTGTVSGGNFTQSVAARYY